MTVAVDESDWSPLRRAALTQDYGYLRLGPLALGPPKWSNSTGQTHLALTETDEEILLVDRMILASDHSEFDVNAMMDNLRHVMGLEHRHIMTIIGAGIDDEIPYVVRRFRLGRPLADVIATGQIDGSLAVALLYPIAEALVFLADAGPQPGVCSVGDFDARDVWIGFDGGVWLMGQGAADLRKLSRPSSFEGASNDEPLVRDLEAFKRLAKTIGRVAKRAVEEVLLPVEDLSAAQVALRRFDREACGRRPTLIGTWMRRHFSDEIQNERAAFGLQPLH
ncbi:MAG: hypothetical protein AAFN74_07990 [Myxococcota bacterium]